MLNVHILTDNRTTRSDILTEHGLSLWIEKDEQRILFDTGQSAIYCKNAATMGVNLADTDFILLSHGHFDHCGGLEFFPEKEKAPQLHVHPDLFAKKYALREDGQMRYIGPTWALISLSWLQDRVIYNTLNSQPSPGIMLSGEIPRVTDFEDIPGYFHVEKDGQVIRDLFVDEQMLVIEEKGGIAVFLGCSHPGVINCVQYAQKLFPGKDILMLIGGMHLENAGLERLKLTIRHLLEMNVQRVIPLHCTGASEIMALKRHLGERCLICSAGDTIKI
jgi:7,8-dihydropterin-6-yl-methyl-4-(beta-D-ribofuranosyl)aminobenzene 5'-phosphate synthase